MTERERKLRYENFERASCHRCGSSYNDNDMAFILGLLSVERERAEKRLISIRKLKLSSIKLRG